MQRGGDDWRGEDWMNAGEEYAEIGVGNHVEYGEKRWVGRRR